MSLVIEQPKIDLDLRHHFDGLAILLTRLESPGADTLHGALVQVRVGERITRISRGVPSVSTTIARITEPSIRFFCAFFGYFGSGR
jgi:hypothetical protein